MYKKIIYIFSYENECVCKTKISAEAFDKKQSGLISFIIKV